jgi:DNA-binding transcriptional regulator YiaG
MSWATTFFAARGSLTQEQAAAACGYSVGAVRDWEQERRTPHPRAQVGILAALRSATKLRPPRRNSGAKAPL